MHPMWQDAEHGDAIQLYERGSSPTRLAVAASARPAVVESHVQATAAVAMYRVRQGPGADSLPAAYCIGGGIAVRFVKRK